MYRRFKLGFAAILSLLLLAVLNVVPSSVQTQAQQAGPVFVQLTGAIPNQGPLAGAAFVDYDEDGDLDIFGVGSNPTPTRSLYRNDGADIFTLVTNSAIVNTGVTPVGIAWGDYNNDGHIDLFMGGIPGTIFRGTGGDNFSPVTTGEIASTNPRGWSPSWIDVDNDGDLDAFMTHPAGFVPGGGPTPNVFFINNGAPDYTFTRINGTDPTTGLAPYTIGSWSDYDLDGDQDLFVGAGPANGTLAPDYFYQNQLAETGSADLVRFENTTFAADRRDGQTVNWIDVENDGDLDVYITSWGGPQGGVRNDLYRNDAGVYTKITEGGLVNDTDVSLANVWADFDNDADIDVFISNRGTNRLYLNNGDGTFEAVTTGDIATYTATNWGATTGDYDSDGDIDLFVPALQSNREHALFRNDLNNSNSWVKFNLVGVQSNRSAIGAKVVVTATINGTTVSQIREVSTQNSFLGHNALEVHFGLLNVSTIDLIRIEWPSGQVDEYLFVDANATYLATEGDNLAATN